MTLSKKFDAERQGWLVIRKQAALEIDPETAEVRWIYAWTSDPYAIYPELPQEDRWIGRAYFARNPRGEVWVSFKDLPDTTRETLWQKHESELAFPAGLHGLDPYDVEQRRIECQFEPSSANQGSE
jgi:hypothetical protein